MPARRPTALKVLTGTFRPARAKAEPSYPVERAPKAPASLSPAARRHWRDLAGHLGPVGILTVADRAALSLLCSALAEHEAAASVVAAQGATYQAVTEAGTILHRERPEVRIAADAWRRALRGLAEFGLTPASRGRVEAKPKPARDAADAFFDD